MSEQRDGLLAYDKRLSLIPLSSLPFGCAFLEAGRDGVHRLHLLLKNPKIVILYHPSQFFSHRPQRVQRTARQRPVQDKLEEIERVVENR